MYQENMMAGEQSVVTNPTLDLLHHANGSTQPEQSVDNPTLQVLNEAVASGGSYVGQIPEEAMPIEPATNYFISEPIDEIAEGLHHVGMSIEQSFGQETSNPTVALLATAKDPSFSGQKDTHYDGAASIFNIGLNGSVAKTDTSVSMQPVQEMPVPTVTSAASPNIFAGASSQAGGLVQTSPDMLFGGASDAQIDSGGMTR